MSYHFPKKIEYIQLSKRKPHKAIPIALAWSKVPLIRAIPDPCCWKKSSASPGSTTSLVTRPPAFSILAVSV